MYVHVLECEYAHERSDACIPLCAVSVFARAGTAEGPELDQRAEQGGEEEQRLCKAAGRHTGSEIHQSECRSAPSRGRTPHPRCGSVKRLRSALRK